MSYTYTGSETATVPDSDVKRLKYLFDLSISTVKGVIPEKFNIYRGDSRTLPDLEKSGGFTLKYKFDPFDHANEIAKCNGIQQFMRYWKYIYEMTTGYQYRKLIVDGSSNRAGIACGIDGAQMSGNIYVITMPKMYKHLQNFNGNQVACIYGSAITLKDSKEIGMHLKLLSKGGSSEFVFLTQVPMERITKS